MKKTIFTYSAMLLISLSVSLPAIAQSHHDSDRDANVLSHTSNDKITISGGGRITLDGAHYINDKTDMSSGAEIGEVRLNLFASFDSKYDIKIDIDFANQKVNYKDIFARWNINKNSSLRLGNFVTPFSMERQKSSVDLQFISQAASQASLTLPRRLGAAYRIYNDKLWLEGGAFASDLNSTSEGGDSGWGVSARALFNPQITDNLVFHIGGGISYRTPDPNGFAGGDDDYNRKFVYQSSLETNIDKKKFLNADVQNARTELRYNAEIMLAGKRFFIQSEYTGSEVTRKRNNQKLFEEQLGGIWAHQTLEAWEKWFGKDLRNVSFSGAYLQAGYLLIGNKYQYNRHDGILKPDRSNGALEIVARYSHTNLNSVDGIFYNGKFYNPAKGVGLDNPNYNYSIGGGILNAYTIGANYYVNKHARLMLNYGYQSINNLYEEDDYAHTIQARLQIAF